MARWGHPWERAAAAASGCKQAGRRQEVTDHRPRRWCGCDRAVLAAAHPVTSGCLQPSHTLTPLLLFLKGGSDFDPKGKSEGELQRFCQSFMVRPFGGAPGTVQLQSGGKPTVLSSCCRHLLPANISASACCLPQAWAALCLTIHRCRRPSCTATSATEWTSLPETLAAAPERSLTYLARRVVPLAC